jgi:hypothetical protein
LPASVSLIVNEFWPHPRLSWQLTPVSRLFPVNLGEVFFQVLVPELVRRAHLAEEPESVGVVEEAHKPPRKAARQSQPAPCDGERSPNALDERGRERSPKAESDPG